jgi:hypothetical protein
MVVAAIGGARWSLPPLSQAVDADITRLEERMD